MTAETCECHRLPAPSALASMYPIRDGPVLAFGMECILLVDLEVIPPPDDMEVTVCNCCPNVVPGPSATTKDSGHRDW